MEKSVILVSAVVALLIGMYLTIQVLLALIALIVFALLSGAVILFIQTKKAPDMLPGALDEFEQLEELSRRERT